MENTLFRDSTLSGINLAIGIVFLCFSALNLLPYADHISPSSEAWTVLVMFGLISLGYLLNCKYIITLTDQGISFDKGWHHTRYDYSSIREATVVTCDIPSGKRAGPALVTLPDSPESTPIKATYETSKPWFGAKQAVLLQFKDDTRAFVFPHPEAQKIVQMIKERL